MEPKPEGDYDISVEMMVMRDKSELQQWLRVKFFLENHAQTYNSSGFYLFMF